MAHDKTKTGKEDKSRIDLHDPSEVEYLHRQFPSKTHDQIKDAIKRAGPLRKEVVSYLQGHASL